MDDSNIIDDSKEIYEYFKDVIEEDENNAWKE